MLMLPAQVQEVPAPPKVFGLPGGLRVRSGSLRPAVFDRETFEVRSPDGRELGKVELEGRITRFSVESAGTPMGALSILERLKPHLEGQGWVWRYEDRGVGQLRTSAGDCWVRMQAQPRGEVSVVLLEPGGARALAFAKPGAVPELPKGPEDFPYLGPWPGARLVESKPGEGPVAVDLGGGKQILVRINHIEKLYVLDAPPSSVEFLNAYAEALKKNGWDIEGRFMGRPTRLQVLYQKEGRDIRATISLWDEGQSILVADVGAQRPR